MKRPLSLEDVFFYSFMGCIAFPLVLAGGALAWRLFFIAVFGGSL